MEMMNPLDIEAEGHRPLKRVEYERLAAEGYFDEERVELLFGVVVEMPPIDPAHQESSYSIRRSVELAVGGRAVVRETNPFAASDISEPEPDVMVVPARRYWSEHPSRAHLIVEVSRSSLRRDRNVKVRLYGLAQVDEYWIVNLVDESVEIYRDPREGEWWSKSTHQRGETITMLAFPDVAIPVSDVLPPEA
jgi:Uma2 family endonuclease